jgi:hypothetical protein
VGKSGQTSDPNQVRPPSQKQVRPPSQKQAGLLFLAGKKPYATPDTTTFETACGCFATGWPVALLARRIYV